MKKRESGQCGWCGGSEWENRRGFIKNRVGVGVILSRSGKFLERLWFLFWIKWEVLYIFEEECVMI